MGSPFSRDQLSPEMRERYGMDKRRSTTVVLAIVAIAAFLGAMAYVGAMLLRSDVQFLLLRWTVVQDDRADATFEVRRDGDDAVVCVLRAQDSKRIDVGYVEIDIPPGEDYTLVNYSLRTVAPAYTVEVLTCARPDELRSPGPQFPQESPFLNNRGPAPRGETASNWPGGARDLQLSAMTDVTWLTQQAHDRLVEELAEREGPTRVEITKRIEAAREEGDLKENGGYHAAKEEQGKNEARIRQLKQLLESAQIGAPDAADDEVAAGKVVTIKFIEFDDEETFFLGSREEAAHASIEVYSPTSPLGSAVDGKKVGEVATYELANGKQMSVEIMKVEAYTN